MRMNFRRKEPRTDWRAPEVDRDAVQEYDLEIAAAVIKRSNREHTADAILREELKEQRDLSPESTRAISWMVFDYYRWFGWLDREAALKAQIQEAAKLRERFWNTPSEFTDKELLAKAVPGWIAEQVKISPSWIRSLQSEPKLWLRARPGQGEQLAAALQQCRVAGNGRLADAIEYAGSTDLFRTNEFHAGEFEIQDLSSQCVSLACDPKPGETWWDACAGEGGKMLHLADLMQNKGLIWASDRAEWRLKNLKRRTARAKIFNYRSVLWNGGAKLPTKTKFDGVLIDAPCSGVGTWQRNPHARWTTTPEDVRELSVVQTRLLTHAAAAVKPGGKLIYSVCTLTRAETVGVGEVFQKQFPEFKPLVLLNPLTQKAGEENRLWLWPQDAGGNGMFIIAWRRESETA